MSSKYKVVHIITKLENGGAQRNTLYTVEHLDRKGYEPILIFGPGGGLDRDAEALPDVRIIKIPLLIRKINLFKDCIALLWLIIVLKFAKVQIVHTHSSKAGILGRWAAYFARVPVIIHTFHGFGFHDYQSPIVKWLYIILERVTAKKTHALIAVSKENVTKGLHYNIGIPNQYTVIHSGIKFDDFCNADVDIQAKKKELGINTDSHLIGMVACFKPQKAPLDFIRMAAIVARELPEVQFLLVGDGELRHDIEEKIKELQLKDKVILAGWRDDIAEIMRILDIFVLTSLWEGLPRVIPEALLSGVCVIATDVDGTREIITDGANGILFAPGDVEDLSEKVVRLIKDEQFREKILKQSRESVDKNYNIDIMVKEIEDLYQECIKKWELQ